jgi:hypothetical protein
MFKRVLVGLSLILSVCPVLPVDASIVTGMGEEVWVFKFETVSGDRQLIRQYRRKLGEVVLSKGNWALIKYFAARIEYGTGRDVEITDIVLLDDNLEAVHMKEAISELPMQLSIANRELCALSSETGQFTLCIK